MAGESTFDVVSKVDKQEVANALNQAQKELAQRYDFKGVGAEVDFSGEKILMKANSEERVLAVLDVLQSKLIRRGISLKSLDTRRALRVRQGVPPGGLHQGGHRAGPRQEDQQADPRRGPEVRQVPDPGRRTPRDVQVPRRPAGRHGTAEGLRRGRPAVRELPQLSAQPSFSTRKNPGATQEAGDTRYPGRAGLLRVPSPVRRHPAKVRRRRSAERAARHQFQPGDAVLHRRVRGEHLAQPAAAERVGDHQVRGVHQLLVLRERHHLHALMDLAQG